MIESTLAKINVFSDIEQYNENKEKIGANELSLVPTDSDAIPVGVVVAYASNENLDGYLLCNGGAVSRTTYVDLFAKIGITYGIGDGSTTFNLPNLTDKFIQGNATAGTVKSAGLPNITGTFALGDKSDAYTAYTNHLQYSSGAFYSDSTSTRSYDESGEGVTGAIPKFNAARCSSIYGNSTTVQPPAVTMRFYIKY